MRNVSTFLPTDKVKPRYKGTNRSFCIPQNWINALKMFKDALCHLNVQEQRNGKITVTTWRNVIGTLNPRFPENISKTVQSNISSNTIYL